MTLASLPWALRLRLWGAIAATLAVVFVNLALTRW